MKSTRIVLMSSLIAALAACDSNSTASNDPSSVPLDAQFAVARATDNAAEAGLSGVLSDTDLAVGSSDLEVPAAGQELLAARVLLEPVRKDTLAGNWWIRTWTNGVWTRVDSIQVVLDDLVQRDTPDIRATAVVSRLSGPLFTQRSVLHDGNADGYVLGNAAEEAVVKLEVVKTLGNLREVTHIKANAGADGDIFKDGDNGVYALDWTRLRGSDTVRSVKLFPMEGDTLLSGDGKAVRTYGATLYKKGPLATHALDLVVRASGTDTAIVGLSGSVNWVSGRVETISVKDQNGGASVEAGDTAVLRVTAQSPSGDSVVSSTFVAHILPGSGLGKADNRVILIEGRREFRAGRFVVETFRLASPEGIRDGQDPTSGSFSWKATLREGGEVSLVGTFTATGVTGTWTDAEGKTTTFEKQR